MTHLADRTIAALRARHDELEGLVSAGLGDGQLAARSGSAGWTVAQLLSHLGGASEIGLATLTGVEVDNQTVWDRWNALSPEQQAKEFVEHSREITDYLEGLDPEDRSTRTIDLGFLPEPVALSTYLGMRLVESVHHTWDVRAAFDLDASLPADVPLLLAEHYAGGLAFLLGFTGKADELSESATVVLGASGYALEIGDGVRLTTAPAAPTATFSGPLESALRLLTGRLAPEYTQNDIQVTGNVTLDDLRRVFPGY